MPKIYRDKINLPKKVKKLNKQDTEVRINKNHNKIKIRVLLQDILYFIKKKVKYKLNNNPNNKVSNNYNNLCSNNNNLKN